MLKRITDVCNLCWDGLKETNQNGLMGTDGERYDKANTVKC